MHADDRPSGECDPGRPIPFNRPFVPEPSHRYVRESLAGAALSGDGPFTKRCHQWLEAALGAGKVLLTTSGTHALEMAALLLDIEPGDEVVVPAFTFVSTVNAFVLRGAKPVFIDVRPDTLNLDECQLPRLINRRTRAAVPVHYGGVGCEMTSILATLDGSGVAVVEDNAHGLLGRYQGRRLGSFGVLAAQSFHETKNFHCGEGGALIVNDRALADRAEILREKGTNRSRFFRGLVDKYTWVDIGSSFLPSDVLAALLYGQLEMADAIQARRRAIWHAYYDGLQEWAGDCGVLLPHVPAHCDQAYHVFYLVLPSLEQRQGLMQHLRERGILSVFHYLPLNLSEMGRRFGGRPGQCPVAEAVADRLLRLPLFYDLTLAEQARVIQGVLSFPGVSRDVRPRDLLTRARAERRAA